MKYKIIHDIPTGKVSKVEMTAEEEAIAIQNAEAKAEEIKKEKEDKENYLSLKASAKAKLVAGEPLTEAEADTLVI